eukprot:84596_1
MIVMDSGGTWYPNKCVEFNLNTQVQISDTPYYDDCSAQGWKIGSGFEGIYSLGIHEIYGEYELVHYNKEETCLNLYDSTVSKTKRTFDILFDYEFLIVGLRFWAKPGAEHNASHWYGIRFTNATK